MSTVFLLLLLWLIWHLSRPKPREDPKEIHVRGMREISQKEAEALSETIAPKGSRRIRFGNLFLSWAARLTHFAFVAATRAGKTLLIRLFLQSVLPAIELGSRCRAIIYENKEDQSSVLAGMQLRCPVISLHPCDMRGYEWDIATDCNSLGACTQTASILLPRNPKENQPFFTDAGRDILAGVLISFSRNSGNWSLRDMVLAFDFTNISFLKYILARDPQTRGRLRYFEDQKSLNNVLTTIDTHIANYRLVAGYWSRANQKVSIKDWARSEFILLVATNEGIRDAIDPINRAVMQLAIQSLLDRPESKEGTSYVVIDEVREFGIVPALRSLLNKGASKDVSVALGFQDEGGMEAVYGDKEAKELLGQCGSFLAGRLHNPDTQEWASKRLGEHEVNVPRKTVTHSADTQKQQSEGWSWQVETRRLVTPSQLGSLPMTNAENGLTFWAHSPEIGAVWKCHIPGKELFDELLNPPDYRVPDFIERPKEWQTLQPWTKADLRRLNLPDDPDAELENILHPPQQQADDLASLTRIPFPQS